MNLEGGIPSKRTSLMCVDYVPALYTHPRCSYQFRVIWWTSLDCRAIAKLEWTWLLRGRRSRNKDSVGEPAEGSILYSYIPKLNQFWRAYLTRVIIFEVKPSTVMSWLSYRWITQQSAISNANCRPWVIRISIAICTSA